MPTLGRLPKLAAALAVATLACTGQVGSGGDSSGDPGNGNGSGNGNGNGSTPGSRPGPGGGSGGQSGGGGGNTTSPAAGEPGPAVFRRLTRVEYNNTVRDLLGDSSAPAKSFPADQDSAKSGFFAGGAIANADAAHLLDATEALAANAVMKLTELLPCKSLPSATSEQDECARDFIAQFGKRAFRRPLTQEETSQLTGFYSSRRSAGSDFPEAIGSIIKAMLLSPQFLYRWEATPGSVIKDGQLVRFNSYEMASRLSYLFWASMPDDTAFALADENKLSTPAQIEAEARRLLKDPRAKEAIADFFTQWLGVTELHAIPKDPKVYPGYTPELVSSMLAETAAFAASAVIDGDGKLSTVFTSNKSFVDANLAKLYGVDGVTGNSLAPTALDPAERGGILTHGSFLAGHASSDESNPTRRGKVMADRVICVEIALPPDDVPDPKPPAPDLSVRERFEEHMKNPCATACHSVMDPLGFAFENYNGIGAYQTMDGGKAVNATGTIKLDGQEKPFKNAIELGNLLGQSKQVGDCMARQFVRYALRRKEAAGDEPSLAAAMATFGEKSNDLRELIVALTKTRTFTHRKPSMGEVLP